MGSGASIATDPTTICLTARGDDRNARRESGDAMRDLVDEVTEENRVATEYVAQRDVTTIYNACKGLGTDAETAVATEPYYEDPNDKKEPRYYQRIAIQRVVEAVARGDRRALLVMATG